MDAIDPATLKGLIEDAMLLHVDMHAWDVEKAVEDEERKDLKRLAAQWRDGRDGDGKR